MKKKIKHYIKEIIVFIVIITILSNIISSYNASNLNKQKLPNINLELIDGSNYTNKKAKPILVHFWATWCPICRLEAQNIQTLSENFEVLSIAVKSGSVYDIQEYMNKNKLTYKVYNDEDTLLASKYNIVAYPTTFIYDKNRDLIFSEVGYTSTIGLWLRMLWASY